MVTRLTRFTKDPNGLGRGAGFYYLRGGKRDGKFTFHRGEGVKPKTIDGPYYSKYSKARDTDKKSQGWRVDKIGIPKNVASKYGHITDGEILKRLRR